MKAIRFVSFSSLVFFAACLAHSLPVAAQTVATSVPVSDQLSAIEKRLKESELREKQILENQAKIFDELQKLRVLVRRS